MTTNEEVAENAHEEVAENAQREVCVFQRRHYEKIAATLHRYSHSNNIAAGLHRYWHGNNIAAIIESLVTMFERDNPRFDSDRFRDAVLNGGSQSQTPLRNDRDAVLSGVRHD